MCSQILKNNSDFSKLKDQHDTNESVRLLFVGSPLLDISIQTEEETLRQYGLKRDDCIIAREDHSPLFQKIFRNPGSRLAAGGSAQNAARIAKWIVKDKGEVAFAGCTGCDEYEIWMKSKLQAEGVLPLYVKLPDVSTGVCACLLSGEGDRSMCCRQGAAALFSTDHLSLDFIHSNLNRTQCIFVEGYFIVHSPKVVYTFAEHRLPSQIFSLSLSAEYVCRSHWKSLLKVIPKVDILFGNETEVRTLATAIGGRDDFTMDESVKRIHRLQTSENTHSSIFIVTRGSKPLIAVQGSNDYQVFDIQPVDNVVDSVGCGDALSGAFLAEYIQSRDVVSAVHAGIEAARRIIQVPGCDPPL
ncbi:adenosine kinase 2 [Nephila pilipes]|uniref:Adenosine kinase n=1 Tax=Nephila pilipes TaxID=299642 RepID=A0A8X6T6D5_NEPPI|nr:adenosine kinase 2 [Nephila pilipes]